MKLDVYDATVVANNDEEKKGRIKVACAALLGDEERALPMWIPPNFDWGWFVVPDIGEIVQIEMSSDGETDELPGQSSVDDPDIFYRGKRSYTKEVTAENIEPREINEEFLGTTYPKRRGFATPTGHFLYFDDSEGSEEIKISWTDKTDAQTLIINKDGIKITDKHANIIELKDGEIKITSGDNILVTGKDFTANTDTVNLVNGADNYLVRGDDLITWLNSIKHTHPTGMGPSGTVTTPALAIDFLSTAGKLK